MKIQKKKKRKKEPVTCISIKFEINLKECIIYPCMLQCYMYEDVYRAIENVKLYFA